MTDLTPQADGLPEMPVHLQALIGPHSILGGWIERYARAAVDADRQSRAEAVEMLLSELTTLLPTCLDYDNSVVRRRGARACELVAKIGSALTASQPAGEA